MPTPPPLPTVLAQAQQHEGEPAVAVQDYKELYSRCQGGAASELVAAKDDCGTVAFRLGQSLERAEKYGEAAQVFLSVDALSRDRKKIARAKVRAALLQAEHLGAPEDALRLCRQVIAEAPAEIAAEDALRLLVRLRTEQAEPRGDRADAAGLRPASPAGAPPTSRAPELQGDAASAPPSRKTAEPTSGAASELTAELDRLAESLRPHETLASFAWLYGAQAAERRGQPAEAVRRYDEIWRRYPRGPLFDDSLVAAAQLLRRQGRSAEAAERLAALSKAYTSSLMIGHYHQERLIEGMFMLGEVYLRDLGRPQQAIETFMLLLKRQPDSRLGDDALLLMAQAALQLAPPSPVHHDQACGYLARLLRDYPDSNQRRKAQALKQQQSCP